MLPSADKLYGDADFIFQQDLAPAHTAKGTKSWFNDHGVGVLDWPANSPDLNPGAILGFFQLGGTRGATINREGPILCFVYMQNCRYPNYLKFSKL